MSKIVTEAQLDRILGINDNNFQRIKRVLNECGIPYELVNYKSFPVRKYKVINVNHEHINARFVFFENELCKIE